MRENGTSLDTIYDKCRDSDKTIMVLRDQYGSVFGGYCTEPWDNNNCFFGDGETILFTFGKTDKVKTYRWSGHGNQHMFADKDIIGIGGSEEDGCFALCIPDGLLNGTSQRTETY